MKPAVLLDNVSKRFVIEHGKNRTFQEMLVNVFRRNGHREVLWALRDVTMEIAPGETLGIIGPNGSGKSTILKLIAGVLQPTGGCVHVNGRIAPLLELGAGFHPDLSGRENILLNGILLGMTRGEVRERIDPIIAFAELKKFIDSPLRHYSSGMYMRLAFSVAVHAEPEILLIDEILAVGDEAFQQRCADKIREFQNAGKTIVIVSHDTVAHRRFCDTLALVHGGHILERGRPGAVIDAYHDLLLAQDPDFRPNAGATPAPDYGVHSLQSGLAGQDGRAARLELDGATVVLPWKDGVRIRRAQLLDGAGEPTLDLLSGEESCLVATLEFSAHVEGPIAGLRLRRKIARDTVEVYSTCTAWLGVEMGAFEAGQTVDVQFRQRLDLGEGDYLFDLLIGAANAEAVFDVREEALVFRVRGKGQMAGIADLHSTVTIETAAPTAARTGPAERQGQTA